MSIEIRTATVDDLPEMARQDGLAFGFDYTSDDVAALAWQLEPGRFLLAHDAGALVGIAGDYPFEVTVPGGRALPTPGVTWVSVSPTHRGQGLLRQFMTRQLRGYRDAGYAMAVLTASQAGIYRRFGYGAASSQRLASVDRRARLLEPPKGGSVRSLTPAEAGPLAADLHERWRMTVPGAVSRDAAWWRARLADPEHQRDQMTALSFFVHPEGYLSYRTKAQSADGRAEQSCWVTDFVALTPQAHAELWQVLLSLDLHASIDTMQLPADDPLPQLLDDPRLVRTLEVRDGIWVRPLDVSALLAARTYGLEFEAVLAVADPLLGDGRYRLRGGPGGATCTPTDAQPDLSLDVAALGAIYLGGTRVNALRQAGRVQVEDPAMANRLDLAFLAEREPFHGTAF